MSWVHWVIEGSCLWYKRDSHDATEPIAKAGEDGANRAARKHALEFILFKYLEEDVLHICSDHKTCYNMTKG